jgi:protein-L-isoaspartate(D-aspartate) O-methyltransferase
MIRSPSQGLHSFLPVALITGCLAVPGDPGSDSPGGPPSSAAGGDTRQAREEMVRAQIEARGIRDPEVLRAMRTVDRSRFVPEAARAIVWEDRPAPIGEGQTISQPYIVALMTELAHAGAGRKVLEVGTGSGYQAAVLAEMKAEVWSIEILPSLAKAARAALDEQGYTAVRTRTGDGYAGWPEAAPFDAILVTAAPDHVPPPLVEQLAMGGRLIIPVGRDLQFLTVMTRTADGITTEQVAPVRFVPLVREIPGKSP